MKTVNIRIATDDLQILKQSDYRLCFAKKIANGVYNVVWQSYNTYLPNNSFSWMSHYELFGSQHFHKNTQVEIATNSIKVKPGETSILNHFGIFERPLSKGLPNNITVNNDYGPIHVGLSQLSVGITSQSEITPIYVTRGPIVKGQIQFTLTNKVLVWFEQNVKTGMIISPPPVHGPGLNTNANSCAIEVDLSQTNSVTVKYENGEWTLAMKKP